MSKVLRMLASGGIAAVLGVVLLGLSGALVAQETAAQSPPSVPATFAGSVTIDGQPAAAGTVIEARVGGASCGVTQVFVEGGEARYSVKVDAKAPDAANCGEEGSTVSFVVGGKAANETGTWRNYELNLVNLTVTSETPATASPSASPTPKAPATGSGVGSGSSNGLLFVAMGLGALVLGASGAAVARRSR
ncbi:MAG: hypothetical protein M0R74_06195 [Dehalococcoidia bacterium]|nr:hypothetical protein [Dehalococcoidia bacterium]